MNGKLLQVNESNIELFPSLFDFISEGGFKG